jgi:hypothetical protein
MSGRIGLFVCMFACALASGTVSALEGTGAGTIDVKLTIKGCASDLESGQVTRFSIGSPGDWSMFTTISNYAGVYTSKKRNGHVVTLELDQSNYDALLESLNLRSNELCGLPAGTLVITDFRVKKFVATLAKDRAAIKLKLAIQAQGRDGTASFKLRYSMLADIAFKPAGITLSWIAPVTRSDGTPLSLADIAGYRIYYGKSARRYSHYVEVADGTVQMVTLTDLPMGTNYLVMTTIDVDSRESKYSEMTSLFVQ